MDLRHSPSCAPRKLPLRRFLILTSALALVLSASATRQAKPTKKSFSQAPSDSFSAAEFTRIVREFSEEGGYFHSDNFTSNETTYLTVVDKLRQLGASGGAYVGVGPEQNFTYIAKIRPRIAFIIDIRRQAMIQHLMYKALFHLSENRAQFLSRLFSRPLAGKNAPGRNAPVARLTEYFSQTPASDQAYAANLAEVRKTIKDDFQFPLSASDLSVLEYVYKSFQMAGLEISFWMGAYGGYPTMRDLIEQPDPNGKLGNYLASEGDYGFVRDLHRRNRIIPVVGDFAGPKALRTVGDYLRKNSYTVTAFYTSSVERYLFANRSFGAFASNVKALPINADSLFIRSTPSLWRSHRAYVSLRGRATVLQKISVFLSDYSQGLYPNYWSLVSAHFAAAEPR